MVLSQGYITLLDEQRRKLLYILHALFLEVGACDRSHQKGKICFWYQTRNLDLVNYSFEFDSPIQPQLITITISVHHIVTLVPALV